MIPEAQVRPDGGDIVVTRFECRSALSLLTIALLHIRHKQRILSQARGLLYATMFVDWHRRTLISISLWSDLSSIYSMGAVPEHIAMARVPRRLGVTTACGVFGFIGGWRAVLFNGPETKSPLVDSMGGRSAYSHARSMEEVQ